jgi:hypothetical protein
MDVADPQEARDGRSIFFTGVGPGIWQLPLDGQQTIPLLALQGVSPHRLWEVVDEGIIFIDPLDRRDAIQIYSFATKTVRNFLSFDHLSVAADTPSLSLSRDHKSVLVASQKQVRSRIMLLRAAR